MADAVIINFPGYLDLGNSHIESKNGGCKGYLHGCKHYENFRALVRDLSEGDRERTKTWHVKREGRGNYRAFELSSQGGLDTL